MATVKKKRSALMDPDSNASQAIPRLTRDSGEVVLVSPLTVARWCRRLQCRPAELHEAVRAVGSSPVAVLDYLAARPRAT